MELSQKKFNLKPSFEKYFKNVGKPFDQILRNLNVSFNFSLISKEYNKASIKNFNKIKLYKNVRKTLKYLKKKIKTAIVTSKNSGRTNLLLKKFNIMLTSFNVQVKD